MIGFKTAHEGKGVLTISKSRFLGFLIHVESEQEVNDTLKEFSKTYYDSTHICYAYVLGNNAEYSRFSDNGEPSGTAGLPILNIIKGNELNNVLIIVVRYFGGKKLGTGGLVRAYSECALLTLNNARKSQVKACKVYKVELTMSDYNKLSVLFLSPSLKVISTIFASNVVLTIASDADFDLPATLTKKTNAKASINLVDEWLIEW